MRKGFSITGILVGIYIIIIGILTASGALGSAEAHGGSSPYSSGYASFGGDYYTYSVNNAAEATSAARAAAGNLCGISDLLSLSLGLFFVGFGAADICLFGAFYPKKQASSNAIAKTEETNDGNIASDEFADVSDGETLSENDIAADIEK